MRVNRAGHYKLIPRFILTYLMVLVLPFVILSYGLFNIAQRGARDEFVRIRREKAYTDHLYLQRQMQSIEAMYYLYKNNSSLSGVLDSTFNTDRTVMYQYIKEIRGLFSASQSEAKHIESVTVYTANSIAYSYLPNFLNIQELYFSPPTEIFSLSPRTELFRHFWVASNEGDRFYLTYYAGLMDNYTLQFNGVLAIRCNEEIFGLYLPDEDVNTSTFIYSNDRLLYTSNNGNSLSKSLIQNTPHFSTYDADVMLDESSSSVISVIRLKEYDLILARTTPISQFFSIPLGFWGVICVFVVLSIFLFWTVFCPLRNITLLAKHLKSVQGASLSSYNDKADKSEIGDLIHEYNEMVNRTNELSNSLHQNEILLRNAQIEVLQSQINPHFFYGTLENIRMTAELHGETLIADIAYNFGNLMRYSLSRDYFVAMDHEVNVVKQYIEIQKKRLRDRFSIQWEINADLSNWSCPKFILFAMVENVFTHDVKKTRQTVNIKIDIQENNDEMKIVVNNDGPGIDKERLAVIQRLISHPEERVDFSSNNNGRSIFNISDRLRLYYGNHYTFNIESEQNHQTVCSVTIHRNAKFSVEEIKHVESHIDR